MSLHRYSILVAILAMMVILSGAVITSTEVAARQSQSTVSLDLHQGLHRSLAITLAMSICVAAIWASTVKTSWVVQGVGWSAVVVAVADAGLGWHTAPLAPSTGVLHALLSHLLFSLTIVIALLTSSGWRCEPERVDGSVRPLLRPLVVAIPLTVFLQITLGAAYRHDAASVMPHMAVAMGVAFLALIGCSQVLQNFPEPAAMRRASILLISIVLTQVCLGITAFLMLLLSSAGSSYFILVTVAHVAVGASTLAASVVLAMEVWRSVIPKPRD